MTVPSPGKQISNCAVAVVHALEYPMGGELHVSHGAGNGLLLPFVMRFNLPERRSTFARIATLLGEDTSGRDEAAAAELAISAVEKLKLAMVDQQRDQDGRKGQHHVADPHDEAVDTPADKTRQQPQADAQHHRQGHRR